MQEFNRQQRSNQCTPSYGVTITKPYRDVEARRRGFSTTLHRRKNGRLHASAAFPTVAPKTESEDGEENKHHSPNRYGLC